MKNGGSAGSKCCVVEAVGSEIFSRVGFHVKCNQPSMKYCRKNENHIFVKQVHGDAKKKKANLTKTQSKLLLPSFTKCIFEAGISLDTVP